MGAADWDFLRGGQIVAVVGKGAGGSSTTDSPSEKIVPSSITIAVSKDLSSAGPEGGGQCSLAARAGGVFVEGLGEGHTDNLAGLLGGLVKPVGCVIGGFSLSHGS